MANGAQHPKAIPNQHASYDECDTVHMYVARKNVLENREITLILKGEMSFATETSLVNVYALIGRMRVLSSDAVIEGAEAVVRKIIDTYFSPNRTFPELRELMNSRAMDPLREFSEACRIEGS